MILLIDNYDSFTYNLTDYFAQLGENCTVIKNDKIDIQSLQNFKFDRIVISPGPNTPKEAGNLMSIIQYAHDKWPILGICLGHQALGEFFGARLKHAIKPMHGKVSKIKHNTKGIYEGLPEQFNVCRYHSLILQDIPLDILNISAESNEGECMSFVHCSLPIIGIQFHPEAILTEYGLEILKKWLSITRPAVS